MTIRLSRAQARALEKLHRKESMHPSEIGETEATCYALVIAGYARQVGDKYVKVRDLW